MVLFRSIQRMADGTLVEDQRMSIYNGINFCWKKKKKEERSDDCAGGCWKAVNFTNNGRMVGNTGRAGRQRMSPLGFAVTHECTDTRKSTCERGRECSLTWLAVCFWQPSSARKKGKSLKRRTRTRKNETVSIKGVEKRKETVEWNLYYWRSWK